MNKNDIEQIGSLYVESASLPEDLKSFSDYTKALKDLSKPEFLPGQKVWYSKGNNETVLAMVDRVRKKIDNITSNTTYDIFILDDEIPVNNVSHEMLDPINENNEILSGFEKWFNEKIPFFKKYHSKWYLEDPSEFKSILKLAYDIGRMDDIDNRLRGIWKNER